MIKMDNVFFSYNKGKENATKAVNACSLCVDRGDFIGIVGTSGSGKSTLLNLLGGLIVPDSGSYYFDGINMGCLSDSKRTMVRNEKIGFVLQSYGLLNDRNGLENVCLPLFFSNARWRDIERRGLEIMRRLNIEHLKDKMPSQMSGGENQRIAIARALVNNPKMILADEPTGALDSENTHFLMELLGKINKDGTTIVLVTHDNTTLEFCNKVYNIKDGMLKEEEKHETI